ncbi:MAG TPA: heparinase II/III-family protein [Candidatus Hydrogenedentes bacterium]|nr:heparinase II/III-family protein [Candidatus Hydrogenedentota bacterium]
MRKLRLYWHTLRYLYPSQVAWRLLRPLRMRRVPPRLPPVTWDVAALNRLRGFLESAAHAGLDEDASLDAWLKGRLCLAGQVISLDAPERLPWDATSLPRLARFQLHGFRYFRWLLMAVLRGGIPEAEARRIISTVMDDWLRRNPPPADPGWDPYPTAERLLNWIMATAVVGLEYPSMAGSLACQVWRLKRTLEYDLLGNHLLREWAALALAGAVTGDRRWLERGLSGVRSALGEQLLPSGEHVERSWMYHSLALFDLLLLRVVLPDPPEWLVRDVRRMTDALERVLHEDGEFPLFNDAAFGEAPPARLLISLARSVSPSMEAGSGKPGSIAEESLDPAATSRLLIAAGTCLVKGGAPGLDYQPGHAHADPGTWELSVDGLRWVVDSGIHGYAESPLRAFCRSVWAHNTVIINDMEPLECWSVFRVARRCVFLDGRARDSGDGERELVLRYRWFQGWIHTRVFRADRAGALWIEDIAEGQDLLHMRVLVHLHPRVRVETAMGGREWRLFQDDITGPILRVESGEGWFPASPNFFERTPLPAPGEPETFRPSDLDSGRYYYCPRFGLALPAQCGWVRASGADLVRVVVRVLPPRTG